MTILGDLPVDAIKKALGLEIEPGKAFISKQAEKHAKNDHDEDYDLIRPHLETLISSPAFIGQAPKENKRIELVGRLPQPDGVALVAVNIEPDNNGHYRVLSFYRISQKKLDNRRLKGFLKPAPL